MNSRFLILFLFLPLYNMAGPDKDTAISGLGLEEEAYVDDIPFDTERIFTAYLAEEMDKSIAGLRPAEEPYVDDIPFDTQLIASGTMNHPSPEGKGNAITNAGSNRPVIVAKNTEGKPDSPDGKIELQVSYPGEDLSVPVSNMNADWWYNLMKMRHFHYPVLDMEFQFIFPSEPLNLYDSIMNRRLSGLLIQ